MTDLEKLEFIHHAIQEAIYHEGDIRDVDPKFTLEGRLSEALAFVEDIREPYLQEKSND